MVPMTQTRSWTHEVLVIWKASPTMLLNKWKIKWKWQERKVPTAVCFRERGRPKKRAKESCWITCLPGSRLLGKRRGRYSMCDHTRK